MKLNLLPKSCLRGKIAQDTETDVSEQSRTVNCLERVLFCFVSYCPEKKKCSHVKGGYNKLKKEEKGEANYMNTSLLTFKM